MFIDQAHIKLVLVYSISGNMNPLPIEESKLIPHEHGRPQTVQDVEELETFKELKELLIPNRVHNATYTHHSIMNYLPRTCI